jgi:hypothetical protein
MDFLPKIGRQLGRSGESLQAAPERKTGFARFRLDTVRADFHAFYF